MNIDKLKDEFLSIYKGNRANIQVYYSPGRVNLIGEHTDYNGGYVLPCGINYGTFLLFRPSLNPIIRLKSMSFPETGEVSIEHEIEPNEIFWINYPLGVIKEFMDKGFNITGMDLLFSGNIPLGAGLSSSASVEITTAFAINSFFDCKLSKIDLVKLCQHAENEFVGMKCGIMDQLAVGMSLKDHAIYLNCDTLEFEPVPFKTKDIKIVISNTNKRRELASSKYNERRNECEKALHILKRHFQIEHLSHLKKNQLPLIEKKLDDNVLTMRVKHIITENERVREAVECLKTSDIKTFGLLMYESHRSLSKNFEVSCKELDILVDEASRAEGVVGSRMTGGGFGGCTVSLVETNCVKSFILNVMEGYKKRAGLDPDFYIADIVGGVSELIT